MSAHGEVLPPEQQEVLRELGRHAAEMFIRYEAPPQKSLK